MMTSMQQISKARLVATGPSPEFVELCKTLYGDIVDPAVVWTDVVKLSPDQADVSAQRSARFRRNVERSSNAVGIAAGSLGLAASLKDPRLEHPQAGRVARGLRAVGNKMPEVAQRIAEKHPKLGAGLAAGAVATQVANLGGDALIAGTLKDGTQKKKKQLAKSATPLGGRTARQIGATAFRHANPKAAAQDATARRWRAAGSDVGEMLSTTSGKIVTGTLAATGAVKAKRTFQGYEKRDSTADVEFAGTFSKFDDDKRLAFGWASVVKINGAPVVDRQGDYIDLNDLEEAAYNYVHKSRVGGDMHRRNGEEAHKVSDMVESMMFTDDKIAKMGLPDDFPRGWWVGYKIHDEDTWSEVRKGGRTGFSIHGKGLRKDHALDDVMGY